MYKIKRGTYSDTKKNLVAIGHNDINFYDKNKKEIIYKEEHVMSGNCGHLFTVKMNDEGKITGFFSWGGKCSFYLYEGEKIKKIYEYNFNRKRCFEESCCATIGNIFFTESYIEARKNKDAHDQKLTIIEPLKKKIRFYEDFKHNIPKNYDEKQRIIVRFCVYDVYLRNRNIITINMIIEGTVEDHEYPLFAFSKGDTLYKVDLSRKNGFLSLLIPEKYQRKKITSFSFPASDNEYYNSGMLSCDYFFINDEEFLFCVCQNIEASPSPKNIKESIHNILLALETDDWSPKVKKVLLYKCNINTGKYSIYKEITLERPTYGIQVSSFSDETIILNDNHFVGMIYDLNEAN